MTDQRVRERVESQAFPATFLTTSGLTKRFPGVVAVDQVDLTLYSGEIVALLGQNGAGKSTLIQMLAGSHPSGSYDGEIFLAGARYQPQNVAAAEAAGIVLIPQEINIVPDMTVAENILLNHEPTRFGLIDNLLCWPELARCSPNSVLSLIRRNEWVRSIWPPNSWW